VGSIVGNGGLIKKVYFPREVLPLSVVGGALVHFVMQVIVLLGAMLIFSYDFFGWNLLLLPLALVTLVVLATAFGLLLSAWNVYLRDTQHLLEVALLFLFWMSPIVYAITFVSGRLNGWLYTLYLLNPITNIVMGFHRAIYKHIEADGQQVLFGGDILTRLLVMLAFSFVMLWLAQRLFARAQGNFAQEL
jgi:ABC-2 type transport system permease protein